MRTSILVEEVELDSDQPKRYVPITELNKIETNDTIPKEKVEEYKEIIKSKVIVIDSFVVTAIEDLDGNFTFEAHANFAKLQDGTSIEGIDITANENIDFDENLTLRKLNSIIRRCGILEKYHNYFVSDPEIVINSYEIKVKKQYRFFEEFLDGVEIVEDMF